MGVQKRLILDRLALTGQKENMPELSSDCHFKPISVYRGGLCAKSRLQEEVICFGWRDLFGILSTGAGSGGRVDGPRSEGVRSK
jgi:hypothetical protein